MNPIANNLAYDTAMQCDHVISYVEKYGCILTRIVGSLDTILATGICLDVLKFCEQHNTHKILFDVTQANLKQSSQHLYEFATRLELLGFSHEHRVSVVYWHNGNDHRFFETIIHNRGWYRVRYFQDFDAAYEWLEKD